MSAKATTIQTPQVSPDRRRFLDLDLLVKITVPLLLLLFLIIALQMESFGWYRASFGAIPTRPSWVRWEHFIPWRSWPCNWSALYSGGATGPIPCPLYLYLR